GHDLHFARMQQQAEITGDAQLAVEALEMKRIEQMVWRQFDVVMYPSEQETIEVRALSPATVAHPIIAYGFEDFRASTSPPAERLIMFVGGYSHTPKVDAATFLANEIMPAVERIVGPVKLVLAGSNPPEGVRALAGPRVEVPGFLSDRELAELYD